MLDQNDLQAIAQLMAAMEARMDARMDAKMEQQEARMDAKMEQQEARIISQVNDIVVATVQPMFDAHEARIINQMNAIIETKVQPQIALIAEQHSEIISRLSVTQEVDSVKGRVSTLEGVVKTHTSEISELKKAQ